MACFSSLRRAWLLAVVCWFAPLPGHAQFPYDVPYVPTPPVVVEEMLRLANVGPDDFVIDLGSGDGRILIAVIAVGEGGPALALTVDEDLHLDGARVIPAQAYGLMPGFGLENGITQFLNHRGGHVHDNGIIFNVRNNSRFS